MNSLVSQPVPRLILLLSLGLSSASFAENFSAIVEAKLKADMAFLSDDARQGRGVGTKGMEQAATYIAQSFESSGLRVDLFDGKPFQQMDIPVSASMGPAEENSLDFFPTDPANGDPRVRPIGGQLDATFRPMAIGDSASVEAELVFAGFGITAPEYEYDDYAKIDVRDKVVVILRKEPAGTPGDARFEGSKNSRHAYFETKIKNASDHGAVGVLLVNDVDSIGEAKGRLDSRIGEETKRLNDLARQLSNLPPEATNSRQTLEQRQTTVTTMIDDLRRQRIIAEDGLLEIGEAGDQPIVEGLPVASLARGIADQLLRAAGYESVDATVKRIDRTVRPSSTKLMHRVKLATRLNPSIVASNNVLGVLEGRGPLSEETVIVGAHYDHVGMGGYGSLAPGTVAVHNGADDNASGTATLLASVASIRDRLQRETSHRRIVFIAFTGEERGLLGSEHYVRNPRFPLESTVAMINLDMVGRLRDNDLTVYGTGTAIEMESILDTANRETGFELFKVASGYGPSDHQSFYSKNIPVLFFFTGLHNDYHRPSDDFDKINFNGMARVTDITSGVAALLATRPTRPQYAATERDASIRWQARGYLGVQLGQAGDGGVLVSGLMPGGAAEKAGILVGDRLNRFNDSIIRSTGEALELIQASDPGDPLEIELLRGVETLTVTAVLQSRPAER